MRPLGVEPRADPLEGDRVAATTSAWRRRSEPPRTDRGCNPIRPLDLDVVEQATGIEPAWETMATFYGTLPSRLRKERPT